MRKLFAFTLSEVMITMTIVGVVAAMTIPTLHYQRVKKEYTAKLKNFYSRMENSILDMEMDKGSFRDMRLPTTNRPTGDYNWYMENIDPYMGHNYVNEGTKTVYYKDGSSLRFICGAGCGCLDVSYDVNGDKAPNQTGYDRQTFLYCFSDANRNTYFGSKDVFFGTYGASHTAAGTTRAKMITQCKDSPSYCTRLLQNDQWEFKGDYPFKF